MVFAFLFSGGAVHGGTFMVTNTLDSGLGSLRWAITNANANPGPDTINFQITGTAPFSINLLSALPAVTDPVTIDATTQPEWAVSGTPVVELNGTSAGSSSVGLQLNSASNRVVGLAINRFGAHGIVLSGIANVIQGNFIGTDRTGTVARGNGSYGIFVQSWGNQIGSSKLINANVISGGNDTGIYIYNTSSNVVQGNYIGISATGTSALGNQSRGIMIDGSSGNLIGGPGGARNFISGNGDSGVYLHGAAAGQNVISNNFIGTDYSGGLAIGNANDGVTVDGAPSNAVIGNVISGNGTNGVFLAGAGTVGNIVAGNFIGTDAAGILALGNHNAGVTISTASGNLIGGSNVISGNPLGGILLTGGASGNLVQGNVIGLTAAGTNALPNGGNGISISGASSNTVGGAVSAARNLISGNANNGIGIYMVTDVQNTVAGNYIGTDVTGTKAVPNTMAGVYVEGCSNVIGGATAGGGNVISGNSNGQGVLLFGNNGNVTGNIIQGNIIGLDATGANSLGNGDAGVGIDGAANNQVGGTAAGARNILSANGGEGIYVTSAGATNNVIQGNYIGTDQTGMNGRGNTYAGINIQSGPSQVGGTAQGAGNLISANGGSSYTGGIYLAAPRNVIQGNFIGTTANGVGALGNFGHGIDLRPNATNNVIGGIASGAGNRIAFAQDSLRCGVRVRTGAFNNLISGNAIFSNGALGIDLDPTTGAAGVGVNAIVDCESGVAVNAANRGQNYPVLTIVISGIGTQIRGTLDGIRGKTYSLQFFSSPVGDQSGYGEGQVFLGQTNLTLGASSCTSNFTAILPASVPAGWVVTATATDPANNTSEFSAWTNVVIVPQVQASAVNRTNQQFSLSWTNNGGSYVLQQTFSLTTPQQWIAVTNAPLLTNRFFVLTLNATNGDAFYRLLAQ